MACQVLDYHALAPGELAQSKTIRLEGELAAYPILLLIDSGANHNFIVRELLSSLNLEVTMTKELCVGLGNGGHLVEQIKLREWITQLMIIVMIQQGIFQGVLS